MNRPGQNAVCTVRTGRDSIPASSAPKCRAGWNRIHGLPDHTRGTRSVISCPAARNQPRAAFVVAAAVRALIALDNTVGSETS